MFRAFAFGFLGVGLAVSAAHAEILILQCNTHSQRTNVYRYDLTIDLLERTVHEEVFRTLHEDNHDEYDFRNRKADPNMIFDDDQYVLVSDDRVVWGSGKPTDGDAKIYYRDKNVLNDGLAIYQCTSPSDSSAPSK